MENFLEKQKMIGVAHPFWVEHDKCAEEPSMTVREKNYEHHSAYL
jgi:hypothetical protein